MAAFHRTVARYMSRRMTLPQLSPTHSQGRILKIEVSNGTDVVAYDPIFIVECSPDLVTEAYRDSPNARPIMMIDTQEEGVVKDLKDFYINQWIPVGTELGIIDDGDPLDGDWTWQAYLDTFDENDKKDDDQEEQKA